MSHYDIIIITPGSSMVAEYVTSLTKTLSQLNHSYKWLSGYSSLVHNAREISMGGDKRLDPNDRGPLHGNCTYSTIVWIDSDICWEPDDFSRLLKSPYPITTGAYLLADGTTSSIHTPAYPGGLPKSEVKWLTDYVEVDAAGFGFIAIKSGVFEKIPRPWFGMLNQRIYDDNKTEVVISVGEDISWCVKAQQAGYKVMFDPRILVGHVKSNIVRW